MVNRVKNNFSSGELDPLLHGRVDLVHYQNGLRTGRNIKLLPQGGFRRREGSRFVEELVPKIAQIFIINTITTPNGGTGANAADNLESTGMSTTVNIGTTNPYVAIHYDLGSAKSVRFADVVGFRLSSGTVDANDWFIQYSTDDVSWTSLGLHVPVGNETIGERTRRRTGPVTARYWRFARIGSTDYGAVTVNLRGFNLWEDTANLSEHRHISHDFSDSQKYMILATDQNLRVYKNVAGAPVRQSDIRVAFTGAQLSHVNWTQSLDTLIMVHGDVTPHKIQRQGADTQWQTDLAFFETQTVFFGPETVHHTISGPAGAEAFAGIRFTGDSQLQRKIGTGGSYVDVSPEEWHYPHRPIKVGEYEIRATLSSGDVPTFGTMNAWLDLNATREWYNTDTDAITDRTSVILFEIRDVPTQIVLHSETITLIAQSELA